MQTGTVAGNPVAREFARNLLLGSKDWGRLEPLQHHLVTVQAVNHSLSEADPNERVTAGKAQTLNSFFLFFADNSLCVNPNSDSGLGGVKTGRQAITAVHNL